MMLFGHRGAAGEAPENTLPGFFHAWEAGVRCFETDVRMAADGALVLAHDASLLRTTGQEGTVDQFSSVELAGLNACQAFPDWHSPAGIPSLHQVFEAFHDRIVHWQLEIKTDRIERMAVMITQLCADIDRFGLSQLVTVTSFDPNAIRLVRDQAPWLACGLISEFRQPEELNLPIQLGCRNVCLPLKSSSKAVALAARKSALQTTGWLGNDARQLQTLLEWRVDSITTDFPSMAIPYLAEHGRKN